MPKVTVTGTLDQVQEGHSGFVIFLPLNPELQSKHEELQARDILQGTAKVITDRRS